MGSPAGTLGRPMEQEEAGVLPIQTCLENERPKDPSFLTAKGSWDLLPDAEGGPTSFSTGLPPGVHGRKEVSGWIGRRKEEEESVTVSN